MKLRAEPLSRDLLVELLRDVADRVETGDSLEGFIEYGLPDVSDDDVDSYLVTARYRIGNLQGQGGLRVVGRLS